MATYVQRINCVRTMMLSPQWFVSHIYVISLLAVVGICKLKMYRNDVKIEHAVAMQLSWLQLLLQVNNFKTNNTGKVLWG
jgi:hypothetical protein